MIDLRTDTVTRPTAAMRRALASADVGDEQKREDPTVLRLEQRAAQLLGHERAVFMPSATMANQVALRILSEPGDELLGEPTSHIFRSEAGGPAVHAGLMLRPIPSPDGRFDAEAVLAAATGGDGVSRSPAGVVAVENTHSNAGGRVWPVEQAARVVDAARELGARAHLDGARLLNAAVSAGVEPRAWGTLFDTVALCLSKGLGCPFGAVLAGSHDRMERAWRLKHQFGGALRQAGIAAAAGLHALDRHVERLAEDHANARRLAAGLESAGVAVDPAQVETNFVLIDVGATGLTAHDAIDRLSRRGVLVSTTARPGVLRAVTHLDISEDDIDRAVAIGGEVLRQGRTVA